ncbi:MAG: TolC family outer membrane protein [Desulfobacteraceae bacterium]|nr:TolC family outer membrane protein [Desulfobacteraceae bacterium]
MKKKRGFFRWFVPAVFLVMLFSSPVLVIAGEDKPSQPIPLSQVLEIVTRTHPEILEAQRRYGSVLGERSIATSGFLPKIGTELTAGQEITDGEASNDERENLTAGTATLYARQNLYNGGKTTAFVHETDARILSAGYEVLTVANRVYLQTAEAYLNVLKTRELLALARENVLTQEKILEQVREKTASGFNRISDLKNSEARLALARSNYIARQQDLNQAVVKVHHLVGRFIALDAFVKPKPGFRFPDTVEEIVDIAFNTHPALDVAKYNIQVRKYAHEKAKADYLPGVDLELKVQHSSNTGGDEGDTDQASAMLKFYYTFFDGGLRKGEKIKTYEFLRKEYQRSYVEIRNVNQSARLAWNILQAETHKRKYLIDYVDMSAATLEAFREEYHIGRRTLLDLLNMENEYHAARNSRTESVYSYLTAYYRIAQVTGVMLHEFDSGLREKLNLPSEKSFDLKGYEALDRDRDVDSVEDVWDQCDNSIKGSPVLVSGCGEENAIGVGYRQPRDPSPYIQPEEEIPEELNLMIDMEKEFQSVSLDSIHFSHDSAVLTGGARKKLTHVAEQLKAADGFFIEVIGHTDSLGSNAYNNRLSRARAKSVYNELITLGVSRNALTWSGKGEEEPVVTNETTEGRKKNRRTEFTFTREKTE